MIKWIFFDVGSTLVDESKAWEKRVSDTVKGSNISVSGFYKLMDDCALKNLIPYDDAVIISGLNRAEWHSELEMPYKYSENVLSQLYGKYKIGVIANQPLGTQKTSLKSMAWQSISALLYPLRRREYQSLM